MHLTTNVRDAPDALQLPLTFAGILVFTVSVTKSSAATLQPAPTRHLVKTPLLGTLRTTAGVTHKES
jgi:hypothetical protein